MRLTPAELRIVTGILREHVRQYEVWAFGSRVHGRHVKPFSDLDLAIITETPLALEQLLDLRAAFSDSDLPFRVDIVDWASADPSFQQIIAAQYEVVPHRIDRPHNDGESNENQHALPTGQAAPKSSH
jgi:uncharacterized protein